jgi:hypothetical protein
VTNPAFSELERDLAAARRRLDALRAAGSGGLARQVERPDGPPAGQQAATAPGVAAARGRGEAAEGRVRVVAVSNDALGLIESAELEPRLLRMETSELSGHIQSALNAALDDMRASAWAAPAAAAAPGIDVEALAKRLTGVHDQATQQLYQLTSGLQDVMAKIGREAAVSSAVAVPDVGELFEETLRILASVAASPDGPGDGQPPGQAEGRGHGEAGTGGLVRAEAAADGRVESLVINLAAVRKGSHEVAAYVIAAVNAALDDSFGSQRERFAAAAADRAVLAQRVRAVQDLSLRQMRVFGESLAGLIAGIAPRS